MNADKQGEARAGMALAPFVCSCLSAFIRVHPRLLLLVCLGSGGRKEKKWDMNWNFVGAELRGKYDYAVRAYEKEVALRLRYLERIPLGTSYTEVVERVAEVNTEQATSGGVAR